MQVCICIGELTLGNIKNIPGFIWVDCRNIGSIRKWTTSLEPVCCKKQQKKVLTSYWFVQQGTSEGSEQYEIDPG